MSAAASCSNKPTADRATPDGEAKGLPIELPNPSPRGRRSGRPCSRLGWTPSNDYAGRDSLSLLQRQLKKAGIFAKSRLREPIAEASETVEAAKVALERAIEAAGPYEEAFYRADRAYEKAARIARIERSRLEVGETQREGPTREAPGLSL